MKRLLRLPSLLRLTLVFLIALVFQNCSEQKIKESTDETLNITEYLRDNPDYSMFLEILDLTNYASFMNTYGTYTIFVPNNEAVQQYLNDLGAASLSEVPLNDLKNIAMLHILDKVVNTNSFNDGKIATPSLYGQFLITGAANAENGSSITVNKTARIVTPNIILGNGVVHVLDKVLRVADKTLAQTIEEDPNLSLFTELLKETGWFDKLNNPITYDDNNVGSYLTVLAQTNEVFNNTKWKNPENNNEEITLNTIENLKLRYSKPVDGATQADPKNLKDSLNLFVQYRILPGLNYMADLATKPSFETKAPLEVISARLSNDTILLNDDVFNGIREKGVAIVRNISDVTASNGVLHYVESNFNIKKRLPAPVYFDLCDQPEFKQNTAVYRVPGKWASYSKDQLSGITWEGKATTVTYTAGNTTAWRGDVIELLRLNSSFFTSITFDTPVIIKGRYKVWVSYRTNTRSSASVRVLVNDMPMSRLINFREYYNSTIPERVYESQGYKTNLSPVDRNYCCRLVGIVEIPTTGRHKLKFERILDSSNGQTWIDVVEFRPVEMDQLYPRLQSGGDGLVPQ
ncbi:fasciclin domain-containing protein [Flavobacterium sp. GSA192]|uniref:fasciclin domain-containing protein n=1 Tax=Flavobacterium sp. GSA192 TaxID=2576304 RepID=UPI00112C9943|nr:fasciclin domain-containing protein [Flavobacterium sp. GSA192]